VRKFLLVALAAAGCAAPTESPRKSDGDCIGLTLGEAIESLDLTLEKYPVIEEPPGIARGLKCLSPAKDDVWLYFRRGEAPFNKRAEWSVDNLKTLRVIGIARRLKDGWNVEGEVIWYYHSY